MIFPDVPVSGSYRLIYLVYNTFYNLLSQDDQVRCFENVARHLTDDGEFLVEAAVLGFAYHLDDQYVDAEVVERNKVTLDVGRYDPVTQLLDECHVTLTPAGIRIVPIVTRFVWPSELDLMARLAGLRLHARWGGWQHEPFDAHSARHVSAETVRRVALAWLAEHSRVSSGIVAVLTGMAQPNVSTTLGALAANVEGLARGEGRGRAAHFVAKD